jgi:[acyl-carrier-protein] S-malonyltransferase/trans-AT polyketide synthase/acyltransferase/oxidoreductase domain-containing protein
MAHDFVEAFAVARDTFAEASDALGLDVAALCSGSDDRLGLTEYAQPAILTAEIASYRTLEQEFGLVAHYFAGHSLGEYTALCAAGVMPFADAVRIVRCRGAAMQHAVPPGLGGMLAVSGEGVAARMTDARVAAFDLDIASVNSQNQIVLSGPISKLSRVEPALAADGCQVTRLDVSAPFHSRYMRPVAVDLRRALRASRPLWTTTAASRVLSNVLAGFHRPNAGCILDALLLQLSAPVRWLDNMMELMLVADDIVEIGPSPPLRGFFRSVGRQIRSITSLRHAERELRA